MLTQDRNTALGCRRVCDIMQNLVRTVSADLPVAEAARLMWEQEISGAPVVDESGRPVGVISASDIMRVKGFGVKRRAVVGDVMTHAMFSVRPDTTVADLASFLIRADVHRALVMDDGRLVGIVSTSDIVRQLAEEAAATVVPDELTLRLADDEC